MGQTSFEALENMPAVTSVDVRGSTYQPAAMLPLNATVVHESFSSTSVMQQGSKQALENMPTVTSAADQGNAYERTFAEESSVSMALMKQGQQVGFDTNLGK